MSWVLTFDADGEINLGKDLTNAAETRIANELRKIDGQMNTMLTSSIDTLHKKTDSDGKLRTAIDNLGATTKSHLERLTDVNRYRLTRPGDATCPVGYTKVDTRGKCTAFEEYMATHALESRVNYKEGSWRHNMHGCFMNADPNKRVYFNTSNVANKPHSREQQVCERDSCSSIRTVNLTNGGRKQKCTVYTCPAGEKGPGCNRPNGSGIGSANSDVCREGWFVYCHK